MKNQIKNRILTRFLVALIMVMLAAPTLFAEANPEKKTKPDALTKKTKKPKLTKARIDNILDRIEQYRPERAKQLRELRKADPEKFKTEFGKIIKKWALKHDRKSEGSSRRGKAKGKGRGKGKSFAHGKFKDSYGNSCRAQSQYCPFDRADADASYYPQFKGRQHRRQKMFYDDHRPNRRRGSGYRGREQGFRGRDRHQQRGFASDGRSRRQGRRQEMGFGQGRRGRGHGRSFNRAHGYGRREHGNNSGSRRWRNHRQW